MLGPSGPGRSISRSSGCASLEFGGMPDTSSGCEHGSLRPGREWEIPKEIAERPWKGGSKEGDKQECALGCTSRCERARESKDLTSRREARKTLLECK